MGASANRGGGEVKTSQMTPERVGTWQVCGAFLVGVIVGRLGGTEAGIAAGVVVLVLSEVLVLWTERRGIRG